MATEDPQARARRLWSPLEARLVTLLRGPPAIGFSSKVAVTHTVNEAEPWITRTYGPSRSCEIVALVDRMRAAALIAQPGYGTDADRHDVFVELANRDFRVAPGASARQTLRR